MDEFQWPRKRSESGGNLGQIPTKETWSTVSLMARWRMVQESNALEEIPNLNRFVKTRGPVDFKNSVSSLCHLRRFYGGEPSLNRTACWHLDKERDVGESEKEFNELANKWREEIGAESSLSKITGNINYLRIIALGKSALPFILRDLQREPSPWFVALRAITGELKIGKEHAGNFRRISETWINWGKRNGYI
jgi:hypothetical protein